jgi:hypothetical protein
MTGAAPGSSGPGSSGCWPRPARRSRRRSARPRRRPPPRPRRLPPIIPTPPHGEPGRPRPRKQHAGDDAAGPIKPARGTGTAARPLLPPPTRFCPYQPRRVTHLRPYQPPEGPDDHTHEHHQVATPDTNHPAGAIHTARRPRRDGTAHQRPARDERPRRACPPARARRHRDPDIPDPPRAGTRVALDPTGRSDADSASTAVVPWLWQSPGPLVVASDIQEGLGPGP